LRVARNRRTPNGVFILPSCQFTATRFHTVSGMFYSGTGREITSGRRTVSAGSWNRPTEGFEINFPLRFLIQGKNRGTVRPDAAGAVTRTVVPERAPMPLAGEK
jgi:hypothetical protein